MPRVTRRAAVALAAGAALAGGGSRAQGNFQGNWPDRPIRLVVGYPAGGPTDFGGRLLQEPLQQLWGQPLVVENRAGASQIIASEIVAKSPPDGYTLFLCAVTHTSNAVLHAKLPYDTVADFTPIVLLYSSPTVLFCGPDQPFRTVHDVVAAAKKPPGLACASSGNGATGHFALELFRRKAGVELNHVAYRGAPPALQDVVGGRVPITFSTLSGAIGLVRDGKLRPLAVAGPRRSEVLPGVPTLAEEGLEIPDTSPWYGFVGPARLPDAIVRRIAGDVQGLLRRPDIAKRIVDQGGIVEGEGPEEFAARIRRELAENAALAREAGIRLE